MTAAELGFIIWLGDDIPLGTTGLQPGVAAGVRGRLRPLANAGVELGYSRGPRGSELVFGGMGFLGEPVEDIVVTPILGVGVRWQEAPLLLLQAGFALDLVLAPMLDIRPDARLNWTVEDRLSLQLSVGINLHLPRRFDRDADGVSDRLDRCVDAAEDRDGFLDADGCADPDDDQDGVLDLADSCRGTPEDRDSFLDLDGCPEPDNDGDELIDDRDACINEAEDRDGNRDLDGCPDPDNDGDSVLDVADACPNVAEDTDGFGDEDGCPDPDNDGDGVGDRFDGAPNQPENINFFEDADGLPDVLPPILQKVLGPQPRLKFKGSGLSEAGLERAELIAAALTEYPETRVRILVSDPDPSRAEKRALSAAAAVVQAGVVAERVEPQASEGAAEVRLELVP